MKDYPVYNNIRSVNTGQQRIDANTTYLTCTLDSYCDIRDYMCLSINAEVNQYARTTKVLPITVF